MATSEQPNPGATTKKVTKTQKETRKKLDERMGMGRRGRRSREGPQQMPQQL